VSWAYVQVAVPVPLDGHFTYRLPQGAGVGRGFRVRVPFGPRKLIGVVTSGPHPAPPEGSPATIREVIEVLDDAPAVTEAPLALAEFVSDYYLAPPGECVGLLLPPRMTGEAAARGRELRPRVEEIAHPTPPGEDPGRLGARMAAALAWLDAHGPAALSELREAAGVSREVVRRLEAKGLLTIEAREIPRDPFHGRIEAPDAAPELMAEQRAAVTTLTASLGRFEGFLLRGVTGSGKTEVYLAIIEAALARGESALVLVPEIALTPQLAARFRARLGERVAVQHSGLDPSARHEQWLRIRRGELSVVVGARSAVFAPMQRLGVIVIDEEHEASFKQETSPRYHARDLALVRGRLESVPVILGSATPSCESWANAARGKLTLLSLTGRVQERPMPEVEVVDLRTTPCADPERLFSEPLVVALREVVDSGRQAILFLNRRGFASFLLCHACGETVECGACSVTYTWHQRRRRLVCHLCDQTRARPERCPSCGEPALHDMGSGTEQVEERLAQLLPEARVARMDRDTTRGRALERLLHAFRRHELDVLIGTQMVAKGHDFPNVTLVGVLLAELGLGFPDFRAAERTFQLLTQIAGRAGRADHPGRVLIQTYTPEHYAIRRAVGHDALAFLSTEVGLRDARGFPPATHLALFRATGQDRDRVARAAHALEGALLTAAAPWAEGVRVFPAQPAPIERINYRWRYQILVRGGQRSALHRVLAATRPLWSGGRLEAGVRVALDVDPHSFL